MKEQMLTEVIRRYGFENTLTILFAQAVEDRFFNIIELIDLFEEIMEDF